MNLRLKGLYMKSQITIQNHTQLKAIAALLLKNNTFFENVEIKLDLFEVLSEETLLITINKNNNSFLKFSNKEKNLNIFSYNIEKQEIVEYDHNPASKYHSYVYPLSNDTSFDYVSRKEIENVERTFLQLAGFDLSNGFFSENVLDTKKIKPELYLSVFGY